MREEQISLQIRFIFSTIKYNENITFFSKVSVKNENSNFIKQIVLKMLMNFLI